MLDNFNINVAHFIPAPVPETGGGTGVPDTGFFSSVSSVGSFVSNNPVIIAVVISLLVTVLVVFFLRHKLFSNKRLAIIPSLTIFAFLFGFSCASCTVINSAVAIVDVVANTTINIMLDPEEESTKTGVATAEVTLSPEDLENAYAGYTIYAYLDTTVDADLHNIDGSAAISAANTDVSDPEDLPSNSYAIYDIENNAYTAISTDMSHPTKVYFTDEDSTIGDTFSVYYAAKVDNTLPEGRYAYDEAELNYVIEKNPVTFDIAFANAGKTKDLTSNLYKMQDMTTAICNSVDAPVSTTPTDTESTTLVDARDGKIYTVSKLLDGNCWMTQNLALGDASGIGAATPLTPEDTDLNGIDSLTVGATWSSSNTAPSFYYTGNNNYGNLYNWAAAVAGGVVNSGEATSSICPKGWKLPTGGDNGQFKNLYSMYQNYNKFKSVFNIVSAGFFNGSINDQGDCGYWWTRSSNNSNLARRLFVFDVFGVIETNGNGAKSDGLSIRCVAEY